MVDAVRRAAGAGRVLRVAGSGHSFSDVACTDGHLLHLGAMDRLLDVDPASGLVEVEPGIALRALSRELAEHGLALENLGDVDAQTLAGAVATGTHGTGARFPNLSAQVEAVRLVAGDGGVHELSGERDPDGLLAARVAIGALGVMTSLTLRCVPLFTLRRVDEPLAVERTLERLDELVEANDHFEFFAFPYTRTAITRRSERTDRQPEPPDPRLTYLNDVLLENRLLDAVCRAGRSAPRLVPRLNRLLVRLVGRRERVDRSYRLFASRREVRFVEMEYAVPRQATAEAFIRAMRLIERRRFPVGFPLEVRFGAADDAHLSPAHGRDTGYIAVHMYRGVEYEALFRGVEAIMLEFGGRPHWGKRHYLSATDLRGLYPEWGRFQAVRERLDADGVFANDHVRRVLGPVAVPVAP